MTEAIIVALITGAFALISSFIAAKVASNKTIQKLESTQLITTTEIRHIKEDMKEMKEDLKAHNHYAKLFNETIPVVQEKLRVEEHRVKDLEDEVKELRNNRK